MSKPKIVIVADVRTWCWARKSIAIQRQLGDEFDIRVFYSCDPQPNPLPSGFDLYHTYEIMQVPHLPDGLPYVTGITAHTWDGHIRNHGDGVLRRWIEKGKAFHANSFLLAEETRRRFNIVTVYCPNGVDETFFQRLRPRAFDARLVVGFVGKPDPRKGRILVEEACRRAGVEFRSIDRRHTDALPPEAMRDYYQDLHVLVVASDKDGTPNPALEAAACGVAIISNHIGNMPEFIQDGENGRLLGQRELPPQKPSVEAITDALRSLDVLTAVRMGEAARAEIERAWTWKQQAGHYAAMWREALAGGAERTA